MSTCAPRVGRLAAFGLAGVLAACLVARLLAMAVLAASAPLEPCPSMASRVSASQVQFQPGLTRHENWVAFPVPQHVAGYFAVCLDGRQLSAGGGDLYFADERATFHLSTRWVDLLWVQGSLGGYQDTTRWELRLSCDPANGC